MNEGMNRYLDGELRREDLTAQELRELATYEAIGRETQEVHQSIEVPDLTARVLARLPSNVPSRLDSRLLQRTFGWLWAPRPVRLRPFYGLLAAAIIVMVFLVPGRRVPMPEAGAGKVFVQFRLDAPKASTVRLAGSFTGWKPTYTLEEVTPGIWSVMVPLEPGVHNYSFVVNGKDWIADPAAPAVADGFGGVNSRVSILLPDGSAHL